MGITMGQMSIGCNNHSWSHKFLRNSLDSILNQFILDLSQIK
jgi:hypothetical protein